MSRFQAGNLSGGEPGERSTILVVDDEADVRQVLACILRENGYETAEADGGASGVDAFRRARPAAVLLDLRMPGMNGIEVLRSMRAADTSVPVIIITAHGDIPSAVEATRLGAYDFITKPPEFDKLLVLVKRAVEARRMADTVRRMHREAVDSIESILGRSVAISAIAEQIRHAALSDFSLIIQGETGTGKSFIARMIHDMSARSRGPFVMVDVGAIPDSLMESELFGFEKGAFTGADRRKPGCFETAGGGTLFIDELQNISPAMQGKLLTSVEDRRIRPLGGVHPVDVDIRIIGATNAEILSLVHGGKIREDLFFRLGEIIISLPPLRERKGDILFLAQRFVEDAAADLERPVAVLSDDAAGKLRAHSWPGNIRELKNVVRRAVLTCDGAVIAPEDIRFHSLRRPEANGPGPVPATDGFAEATWGQSLEAAEKKAIISAMRTTNGNKTKAAAILAVDYKTLLRKLKKYGI